MHIIKKIIPTFIFGIVLCTPLTFAEKNIKKIDISTQEILSQKNIKSQKKLEIPEPIHLVLDTRIFTINFKNNMELLQKVPTHFLKIKGQRIPLDLKEKLLTSPKLFPIETEFNYKISPEGLNDYLNTAGLIGYKPKTDIKLTKMKKGWIKISGYPTQEYFEIDQKQLLTLLNHALSEEVSFVRVPAFKTYPKVIADKEIQDQGIKEIIAIGRSNFSGSSAARRQNILAAIRKYNGMVLKKGQTFSFNGILKSVEKKDGFVEELVIKGGENKKEMGGGVCQVSTTVFRAAFSGGFPIVKRRNHSYAVSYYKPHGFDATIYLGGQDFKFKNDTPGDILIQGFTSGANLYFVFYGTNDKREVSLSGPFISNYRKAPAPEILETDLLAPGVTKVVSGAHDGFYARWNRTITDSTGKTTTEKLESSYRPWPAKVLKGRSKTKKVEEIIPEKNNKPALTPPTKKSNKLSLQDRIKKKKNQNKTQKIRTPNY